MGPLPRDKIEMLKESKSLGLLGPNPSLEKPRAKLITCIHNSMMINRSINYVSILFVGPSGVGKSATVNHFLGISDVAKTNEDQSETRSTKEFVVHGSDPEYEVNGLPLGLVDTPGFCDTDGTIQDAYNFLSVETFFRTHPMLSKCYPNLILLVVNATDNRMMGKNSDLGKSLRCLKQLNLVDPKNPNVVTVVTHVCSIRKKTGKEWIKALDKIKSKVSKIVFDDLRVYAPVVLIENEYDDCALKHRGDFTCLPNGEFQPKNLYLACADVLGNDSLGLITLNSIFKESKKRRDQIRISDGHEVKATIARTGLGAEEKSLVTRFEIAARGIGDPIYDTISQYIEEQKLEVQDKDELMKIAGVLSQLSEGNPPTFGSFSLNNIEYFLGQEISSIGRKLLQDKFKIALIDAPKVVSESARLIGQGYNIFTGKSVASQVMKFGVATQFGIAIPTCAKFEKVHQSKCFMEVFEDDESYTQSRLSSLNLNLAVKPGMFKIDCRAGYNKKSVSTSSSLTEYSFLFEQRLFELKLGNYKEYLNQGMTFTEDFKSAVAKLPRTYDESDSSCVREFKQFFDRFGHFLVASAYGGGSVEVKCSKKVIESDDMSVVDAKACLAAALEGLGVAEAKWSADSSTFDAKKRENLLHGSTYSWEGGEAALQTTETISDNSERLQKWKESLIQNPMMLTSELTLEPISTAVSCIDDQKLRATLDALEHLLGCKIPICVKQKEKDSSDETDAITILKSIILPKLEGLTCFPSCSVVKVHNEDGEMNQKKMANLDVGDDVMAWDKKRNRTVFSKVIMFAHLAPDAMSVEYLKITLEDGNKIALSGDHLVMVGKQKKAVLARKVKPGDILFSVDENCEISPKKVLAVEKVMEQGIYCPITVHGNVIVDNVLASCYASVEDHVLLKGLVKISAQSMAHLGLMPMRALHRLRSKWLREIPNGQTIHPYLQWLCKLNLPWMAK